jgi:hypothetical protein
MKSGPLPNLDRFSPAPGEPLFGDVSVMATGMNGFGAAFRHIA